MPAREQAQERVQLGALLVVQVGEEVRFETLGERTELRVRALALGRDAHGVTPAVVRVAAALDEPAPRNLSAGPSRPGLVKSIIDHRSPTWFSTGVPVSAAR